MERRSNELLLSNHWELPNRYPRRDASAVVGPSSRGEVAVLLPEECKCEQLAR